jgi:hypothetical protein
MSNVSNTVGHRTRSEATGNSLLLSQCETHFRIKNSTEFIHPSNLALINRFPHHNSECMHCLSYPSQMYGNSSVISIAACWRLVPSQLRSKYRRCYLPDAFEHAFHLLRGILLAIRKADLCLCVTCLYAQNGVYQVLKVVWGAGLTIFWGGGGLVLFANMWQGF